MSQPSIPQAADYANALLITRRAKNWVFVLLLAVLLLQIAGFFIARYGRVLPPAVDPTQPAEQAAGQLAPSADRQALRYSTSLTTYGGIILSIAMVMVLLLAVNIMLLARLIGLAFVLRSFLWCIILALVLFPWQALLHRASPQAADIRIPGVLYTWTELANFARFGTSSIPEAILKWSRFVAFPLLAAFLLLFIHLRSRRGIRLALGEESVPDVSTDRPDVV